MAMSKVRIEAVYREGLYAVCVFEDRWGAVATNTVR